MSYRLIDSNAIADKYPEANDMPCVFADLPNGLDGSFIDVQPVVRCQECRITQDERERIVSWLGKFCRHIDNFDISLNDYENTEFFKEKMYQQFGWEKTCPNCGARMEDEP